MGILYQDLLVLKDYKAFITLAQGKPAAALVKDIVILIEGVFLPNTETGS